MQLPITHMLALAAFRFALTARAVPAGQTSPNTVDQASQIAKDNGVHAGAGANVPPQLKPYVPRVSLLSISAPHLPRAHFVCAGVWPPCARRRREHGQAGHPGSELPERCRAASWCGCTRCARLGGWRRAVEAAGELGEMAGAWWRPWARLHDAQHVIPCGLALSTTVHPAG